MVARKSWAVQQLPGDVGQVTVEDARYAIGALTWPTGAITSRTGLVPTAAPAGNVFATSPTNNGFVHVNPFRAILQSNRGGGTYVMTLDQVEDIDILGTAPADPSNPRNDFIVFQQNDTYFNDGDSELKVRHIVGTPAAQPVDPPVDGSSDYVLKARIRVPANAVKISDSDIDNFTMPYTVALGGVLPLVNAGQRASVVLPYTGMVGYQRDIAQLVQRNEGSWSLVSVPALNSLVQADSLSAPDLIIYNRTDQLLYRWTGTTWVPLENLKPFCSVALTTTMNIPDRADTDVAWQAPEENWSDPTNPNVKMWDPATPTRITILKDGVYVPGVELHYSQNASTGGKRVTTITRNNTGIPTNASAAGYDSSRFNTSGDITALKAGVPVRLFKNNVLRVSTWQNSGVAQQLVGNTIEGPCRFWVEWIRP